MAVIEATPEGISIQAHKLACGAAVGFCRACHQEAKEKGRTLRVYVEAGWLNPGNWHLPPVCNRQYAAAIGRDVGQNQGIGMAILSALDFDGVPASMLPPLQKTYRVGRQRLNLWSGPDGKITHQELQDLLRRNGLPAIKGRTNQDQRDAILIALAGFGAWIYSRGTL